MTTRHWRRDDQTGADDGTAADRPAAGVSGTATVVVLLVGLLLLWFALDRGFRAWRADHEARALLGETTLAPLVDVLADPVPPGLEPPLWRQAVADTHAMLLALAGSGALGEGQIVALRREVADRVARARARPETARAELSALWDDLQRRAGPIIAPDVTPPPAGSRHAHRHPRPARPALLGPSL